MITLAQIRAELSDRKASDHHTSCRDCGRFVPKERWVPKQSTHAIRGQRPLCAPCFDEYEGPLY